MLAVLALLAHEQTVSALQLSDAARIESGLGERLNACFAGHDPAITDGNEVVVTARHATQGGDVPLAVSMIRVTEPGIATFRATGTRPFMEPFLDLTVTAAIPGASLSSNYTLLVDPVSPGDLCADPAFPFPDIPREVAREAEPEPEVKLEPAPADVIDSRSMLSRTREEPPSTADPEPAPSLRTERAQRNTTGGDSGATELQEELATVREDQARVAQDNADAARRIEELQAQLEQFQKILESQDDQMELIRDNLPDESSPPR